VALLRLEPPIALSDKKRRRSLKKSKWAKSALRVARTAYPVPTAKIQNKGFAAISSRSLKNILKIKIPIDFRRFGNFFFSLYPTSNFLYEKALYQSNPTKRTIHFLKFKIDDLNMGLKFKKLHMESVYK